MSSTLPALCVDRCPPAPAYVDVTSAEDALFRLRTKSQYGAALDAMEIARTPVPNIMHQSWKSCKPNPRHRMWQQHCQRLNPAWDAWQWTDAGNDDIIAREFPSFVPLFEQYDMNIKRIDAVRLFYLFLFGGIYIDLDFLCLRPFEALALPVAHASVGFKNRANPGENCSCATRRPAALQYRTGCGSCMPRGRTRILQVEMVPNAFMAAPPRHPFVAFAIHRLNASRDRMFKNRPHPSAATGPVFLTSSVAEWHALKLGGLHAYDYPIVYNSRWGVKHWCSWAANFPETLTVNDARAQFERCAERRLDCVFTSFWTSSWVTQKVKVTRTNSSLMSLSVMTQSLPPMLSPIRRLPTLAEATGS